MKTQKLRIRITAKIPVDESVCPKLGKVYDVIRETTVNRLPAYAIKVNNEEVLVYRFECMPVDENGKDII